MPTVVHEPRRVEPDAAPAEPGPRARIGLEVWGLAGLIGLTCLAAASVSGWLLPTYLVAMALLLLPPALPTRWREWVRPNRVADRRPPALAPARADSGAASRLTATEADPADVPSPQGDDSPAREAAETSESESEPAEAVPPPNPRRGRGGRGRGRSKAGFNLLEPKEVRWVRVGPGQLVRVEGPGSPEPIGTSIPPDPTGPIDEPRDDPDPDPEPNPGPTSAESTELSGAFARPQDGEEAAAGTTIEVSGVPDPPPMGAIENAGEGSDRRGHPDGTGPGPTPNPPPSTIGQGWRLPSLGASSPFGGSGFRPVAQAGANSSAAPIEITSATREPRADPPAGDDLPQADGPAEDGEGPPASADLFPPSAGPSAFDGQTTVNDRTIDRDPPTANDPTGEPPTPADPPRAEGPTDDPGAATPPVSAVLTESLGESPSPEHSPTVPPAPDPESFPDPAILGERLDLERPELIAPDPGRPPVAALAGSFIDLGCPIDESSSVAPETEVAEAPESVAALPVTDVRETDPRTPAGPFPVRDEATIGKPSPLAGEDWAGGRLGHATTAETEAVEAPELVAVVISTSLDRIPIDFAPYVSRFDRGMSAGRGRRTIRADRLGRLAGLGRRGIPPRNPGARDSRSAGLRLVARRRTRVRRTFEPRAPPRLGNTRLQAPMAHLVNRPTRPSFLD